MKNKKALLFKVNILLFAVYIIFNQRQQLFDRVQVKFMIITQICDQDTRDSDRNEFRV